MPTVVIFSDPHGMHSRIAIPKGDILVCAGDCTASGSLPDLEQFLRWFDLWAHPAKVLIGGNHDRWAEKNLPEARRMIAQLAPSVTYLHDSGATIEGLRFWGSPYSPSFMNWYNMRARGAEIKAHWDLIPPDTDVLVTHGPPKGYCDTVGHWSRPDHLGCQDLTDAIARVRPRLAIAGHIHGGYAQDKWVHDDGRVTMVVNGSACTEAYRPTNAPWIVELP